MNNATYGSFTYGGPNGATLGLALPRQVENVAVEQGTEADELDVSWDPAGSAAEYAVLLAETTGTESADYDEAAVTTGTSATLTGLEHGRDYFVRVAGRNGRGDGPLSEEVVETTALPAVEITDTDTSVLREVTLTLAPQDNSSRGSIEIYRSTDGTLGSLLADGLAPDTASYTDTDSVLDGTEYQYTVRRVTPDAQTDADALATSFLPDEDQPTLGNGVKDEIEVDREEAVSNNGSIRYQLRASDDAPEWENADSFQQFIGDFDTLVFEFVGLLDGEEYEVRGQTETDDVTGAFTEPQAITTLFPGVTDLTATALSETEVELDWTDNADNEEGQLVVREERFNGGFGPERIITDVGPDTETYTDTTALPGREYRYRIRAFTPFTSADSEPATATTQPPLRPEGDVPSDGWFVRVRVGGRVLEPDIAGEASWLPKLDTLPEAEVPIENAGRFEREAYDEADAAVWKDGVRLPIDEIKEVDVSSGGSGSLTLRGGRQLKRLTEVEYENEPVSDAARDIIETETDYVANVDDADASVTSNVLQQEVESGPDWTAALEEEQDQTTRWEVNDDGNLERRQGLYFAVADDDNTIRGQLRLESGYVDGRFYRFDDTTVNNLPSGIEQTFDLDYEIPVSELAVAVRLAFPVGDPDFSGDAAHHGFEVRVDGEVIEDFPADSVPLREDPEWFTFPAQVAPDAGPGSATVRVAFVDESSADVDDPYTHIDAVALYDERDNPTLGGVDSEERAEVDQYGDPITVETADVQTVEQVVGGQLTAVVNDTSSDQALAISNDSGDTFPVAGTNTDTISGDFADPNNSIRARFTLGGIDGQTLKTVGRSDPQIVEEYALFTDLDSEPTLINQTFSGDVADVLRDIADFGGFVYEVRRDGNQYSVEFTQPGIRDGGLPRNVEVDVSLERDTSEIIEAAEITGGAAPRNGERFTANDGDSPIPLSRGRIIDGTEQVYDADTGTVFDYNEDYRTNNSEGEIVVLSGGDLQDGEEYRIDYQFKPFGEFEAGTYDGNTEKRVVRTLPSLTSQIACQSAALRLVSANSTPVVSGTLRLDDVSPSLSLVAALEPASEAFRGRAFDVDEVESTPASALLRLSSGETIDETLQNVRLRLQNTEQRS